MRSNSHYHFSISSEIAFGSNVLEPDWDAALNFRCAIITTTIRGTATQASRHMPRERDASARVHGNSTVHASNGASNRHAAKPFDREPKNRPMSTTAKTPITLIP